LHSAFGGFFAPNLTEGGRTVVVGQINRRMVQFEAMLPELCGILGDTA